MARSRFQRLSVWFGMTAEAVDGQRCLLEVDLVRCGLHRPKQCRCCQSSFGGNWRRVCIRCCRTFRTTKLDYTNLTNLWDSGIPHETSLRADEAIREHSTNVTTVMHIPDAILENILSHLSSAERWEGQPRAAVFDGILLYCEPLRARDSVSRHTWSCTGAKPRAHAKLGTRCCRNQVHCTKLLLLVDRNRRIG